MKVFRRGHLRLLTLGGVAFMVLLYVYFHSSSNEAQNTSLPNNALAGGNNPMAGGNSGADSGDSGDPSARGSEQLVRKDMEISLAAAGLMIPNDQCPALRTPVTDINSVSQFPNFEFQPAWMRGREYWDTNFEKRYLKRRSKWKKLPLKTLRANSIYLSPNPSSFPRVRFDNLTIVAEENFVKKTYPHSLPAAFIPAACAVNDRCVGMHSP
ncbi:hypothetical protein FHG87_006059 [Trinorchestia longiramus]|nr:hypothetical protein FHG87_006059 [Trinorchestia longiramus]